MNLIFMLAEKLLFLYDFVERRDFRVDYKFYVRQYYGREFRFQFRITYVVTFVGFFKSLLLRFYHFGIELSS